MKSLQHVLRLHLTIAYIRYARIIVLRKYAGDRTCTAFARSTRSVTARRRRVVSRREFVKAGTAAAALAAVGSRQAMALTSAASPASIVPTDGVAALSAL